jgi:segregation and condensation protein A
MYEVALREFEGPLDLLLFFIKRDELDIHNIPIAQITDEYLQYVRVLEQIDLDGAGDFIYMAAVLMNIKAQMLLPDPPKEDGEDVDPRRELVERLLEYIRHKEAAYHLEEEFRERSEVYTRGEAADERERHERNPREIEYRVSVFELISVLTELLREVPDEQEPVHEVSDYEYSVSEQQVFVLDRLTGDDSVSFLQLVRGKPRQFVITTFLAVLELAKRGDVRVATRIGFSDFFVQSGKDKTAASGEVAAG